MTDTKHSAGAVRAAEEVREAYEHLFSEESYSEAFDQIKALASIIDRETKCGETREALTWALDALNGLSEEIKDNYGGVHSAIRDSRKALGIKKENDDGKR